ncbi:CU044_2847 family protein [Streptomyces sp. NPDC001549]|uniref:CU044_2847 family protein n=1 Tax=Streptomyces sp. NPDC001549 TaxID=3364586 RepID=UPI00367E6FD6
MSDSTKTIAATTSEGTALLVEVVDIDGELGGGEELAGSRIPDLKDVMRQVTDLSTDFRKALESAKPKKASLEFGLKIALKSGAMTALLVDATGEAAVKVTLEWGG